MNFLCRERVKLSRKGVSEDNDDFDDFLKVINYCFLLFLISYNINLYKRLKKRSFLSGNSMSNFVSLL